MVKQSQHITSWKQNVTGLGHQVKLELKSLNACKADLEKAYSHLEGTRATELQRKINDLISEVNEQAGAAEELLDLEY